MKFVGLSAKFLFCVSLANVLAFKPLCLQGQTRPADVGKSSDADDPRFKSPYIDIDEMRNSPTRHRYVHGGFKGTDARFSFYFPPKEKYQGRFFQHITPAPGGENLAQKATGIEDQISFSIESGGYFVETNEGGMAAMMVPALSGYLVNAAAARYSRTVAVEMYGPHRPFGYAWGGSGGAFKAISGFENSDAWDGAVPYVIGSPEAIPNVFTVRMYAMSLLGDKFAGIADALEPGGSGDMYQGLNKEEREALQEVTRMGFPPRAWFDWKILGQGAFPVLFPLLRAQDPTYFTHDFWNVPGYLGANPPESLLKLRVQLKAKVVKITDTGGGEQAKKAQGGVDTAWNQFAAQTPLVYELDHVPAQPLTDAFMVLQSGAGKGQDLMISKIVDNTIIPGVNPFAGDNSQLLKSIKVGDEVTIDNSDFLAARTYHRHQVSTPDFYVWNQFLGADGKPIYPQRAKLIGPMITYGGGGSLQSGKFKGKMIVVESLLDQDAFPWQADWYRTKVKENLGSQLDNNFRLWFTDNAVHGDEYPPVDTTHVVSYLGILYQALRDVSAWVEKGVPPPQSTDYKVVDGQIVVPATAAQRHGVQPVVTLLANGGTRAEIGIGKLVKLTAKVELPEHTGKIVLLEWDYDGQGSFPEKQSLSNTKVNASGSQLTLATTHSFNKPGVYFPVLRATSQREGDANASFSRIQNLARVRVVVQ